MGLDNDIRGWVMSCVSGIACVLGSSIICVDVIARNCFGLKNFKISDSNVFLSASLSLSAGVLLFSSLYSVLPTSKDYFVKAGLSSSAAASALIGLFLAGMVIIQLVSSFIHRHIPSRVVDWPGAANGSTEETQYHHSEPNPTLKPLTTVPTEHSSLLPSNARSEVPSTHRTSVQNSKLPVVSRIKCKLSSLVPGNKPFCDQDGTCYGISHVRGHVDDRALLSSHSLDSFTHHHHVPQNAFLAIGVQTSLAIALHKLPEGFITYATNHANPTLGFSIFMALFIHNITEGFAMTLPLYLALHSKLKAMLWSSLLGGVSQPAGAGLAALWIWSAGKADNGGGISAASGANPNNISWAVYGGMFAATAGVMTSVALQLFSEGLVLSHNRSLCVGFAFLGMGILGFSYALTG
ncbi:predicted protein [Histoplasma mississippiense (nom. inval.)]|uniref:predicted protein n=1 Tax=Ajellomyces capsulatus (strain NAm1 / WU24) TaxID=2059318 RepID=UPI000157D0D7|nr:predicted protein [Histoplasma mississippiense (nom. inval.)]EDN10863.1 predicted protein [Histoplasma mississippiense (nom. inval.)]